MNPLARISGPVSGLANVGTIDPEGNGTFPHLSCSGVLPFLASLTVAGAAPDSHRLPVSSLG